MSFNSKEVVILTRTVMSDGVCVGAYDITNERMLRLLNNQAGKLSTDAPYQISQVYSMTYAERYRLEPPHIEDVAVYQYNYQYDYYADDFQNLIGNLTDYSLSPTELFEGKLKWEKAGFILADDIPSFSVQIATLDCDLEKDGEYFCQRRWGLTIRRIKYVGEEPITNLPQKISSGTKIRFSLARFWDRGNGIERAYIQISGIY